MSEILTYLELALHPDSLESIDDGELVRRFASDNDSRAFSELVRRHGPMVLGVCRRVLAHRQDAEDAFQAVFLVLAQKAGSISTEHLSSWLYTVAQRSASKARTLLTNRCHHEVSLEGDGFGEDAPLPEVAEWLAMLDEELDRLPEKYRLPVLLCELQGLPRSETARRLGWPEGTVAGRLHRAKRMLAERLSRRGVTLSVSALSAWFAVGSARAVVSAKMLAGVVRFGVMTRLGEVGAVGVSASVTSLSEGVMSSMSSSLTKMWTALSVVVLAFGSLYWGASLAMSQGAGQGGKHGVAAPEPKPEPIHPRLVFEEPVQRELRLSKTQIAKLRQAWEAGKAPVKEELARRKSLQKDIEELQKRLRKLRDQEHELTAKINESQEGTLKSAIYEQLSNAAIERLRQLSLRRLSLREVLGNARMRAELGIDDEQLKKLETAAKTRFDNSLELALEADELQLQTVEKVLFNVTLLDNDQKLLEILTPEQRTRWKGMLGKPYPPAKKK